MLKLAVFNSIKYSFNKKSRVSNRAISEILSELWGDMAWPKRDLPTYVLHTYQPTYSPTYLREHPSAILETCDLWDIWSECIFWKWVFWNLICLMYFFPKCIFESDFFLRYILGKWNFSKVYCVFFWKAYLGPTLGWGEINWTRT